MASRGLDGVRVGCDPFPSKSHVSALLKFIFYGDSGDGFVRVLAGPHLPAPPDPLILSLVPPHYHESPLAHPPPPSRVSDVVRVPTGDIGMFAEGRRMGGRLMHCFVVSSAVKVRSTLNLFGPSCVLVVRVLCVCSVCAPCASTCVCVGEKAPSVRRRLAELFAALSPGRIPLPPIISLCQRDKTKRPACFDAGLSVARDSGERRWVRDIFTWKPPFITE